MTLANKITVLRIMAIPIFIILLLEHHLLWAQGLFGLSVLSDAVDGAIARIRRERTPLGTFLDPLADKLLLLATYITFTAMNEMPVWVLITVLSRDMILVLGWTIVYILTGNAKIQPRPLGKITTALQMAVGISKLFSFPAMLHQWILTAMITVTILSTLDYLWIGNKRLGAAQ